MLAEDDVRSAIFTGGVTFEEGKLTAVAGEARYDPGEGTLKLARGDAVEGPRVIDDQLTVIAPTIDVTLETRRIEARGGIKTTLIPRDSASRGAPERSARLPGLLQQDKPANVNADRLLYEGVSGSAVYSGNAALWQGETAIRGDVLEIDQENGDLVATGSARSTLTLDGSLSIGRAHQIRYQNARRQIAYQSSATSAARPSGRSLDADQPSDGPTNRAAPPTSSHAQLTGPQGDLRADRIAVLLAPQNGKAERLEAFTDVRLKLDTRTAMGARLTYHADEERYVLTGSATAPVKVVEACRETVGKTLTFFRSTDRILVDGNEEIRTQTKGGGPCTQSPPR